MVHTCRNRVSEREKKDECSASLDLWIDTGPIESIEVNFGFGFRHPSR